MKKLANLIKAICHSLWQAIKASWRAYRNNIKNPIKVKPEDIGFLNILRILWCYLLRNLIPLFLLSASVTLAATRFFGHSKNASWKNWEVCAWGCTLLYTAYLYIEGFAKGFFKDIGGVNTALILTAMGGMFCVFIISLNEFHTIFVFPIDRRLSMVCLLVTAFLFVVLDFILFKALIHKQPTLSRAYFMSLKFSDIPIFMAFSLLTVYAFVLEKKEITTEPMDYFFGGTIAFQMMLSNVIWTLTSDVFLEHSHKLHNTGKNVTNN